MAALYDELFEAEPVKAAAAATFRAKVSLFLFQLAAAKTRPFFGF